MSKSLWLLALLVLALLVWLGPKLTGNSQVRALIAKLEDKDNYVRADAARKLGELGPEAKPAIPALIRALQSRFVWSGGGLSSVFDRTPEAAREALVSIGPASIPALTEALQHEDALTRVLAAWALWNLEGKSERVLPMIVKLWQDEKLVDVDVAIRGSASQALGEIGQKEPDRILAILLPALKDDPGPVDSMLRLAESAIYALRRMASVDKKALQILVDLLQDERVVTFAMRTLGTMPEAVPLLIVALKSNDRMLRQRAAMILSCPNMTNHAQSAIPALKEALQDEDKDVREWAEEALRRLEKAAK